VTLIPLLAHHRAWEVNVLSKCANPSCSTPLVYLREGKIFMMEHGPEPLRTPAHGNKMPAARVEHFWLCGPCSVEMTLVCDRKAGVRVLPKSEKKMHVMRAAS
jgi:hypothetical protein